MRHFNMFRKAPVTRPAPGGSGLSPGVAPSVILPDPAVDPTLPPTMPRVCLDAFTAKGRWFNDGGNGPGSHNFVYSSEAGVSLRASTQPKLNLRLLLRGSR